MGEDWENIVGVEETEEEDEEWPEPNEIEDGEDLEY